MLKQRRIMCSIPIRLLLGLIPLLANAADYVAGPEDYREALTRLKAGDRLLLVPGDYTRGLPLHNREADARQPIIVQGPAAGPPARFLARPGANTVSLVNVRHVVIRNLELDGRGLAVDAVKAEGHSRYAHFVTLENLHIHGHDASQQNVGISTKCPAHGWVVRGNRIERVGTGMYFGNSDGSAPFVAGLIEDNTVRHTLGYSLQIKHQRPRPADMPGARQRQETVIRRNLFDKSAGGNTGALARPNVLVGHWPRVGVGVEDRYLIYANLFWQNPTEALFQGEGNVAVYNNLFVNHHGPAVRIQPHNDVPRRIDIFHNTVLARDEGIAVRRIEGQTEGPQRVFNNLVLAAQPLIGADPRANHIGGLNDATRWLVRPGDDLGRVDLAPRAGLACDADLLAGVPDDYIAGRLDYNGQPRAGCEFGACTRGPCPSPERTTDQAMMSNRCASRPSARQMLVGKFYTCAPEACCVLS